MAEQVTAAVRMSMPMLKPLLHIRKRKTRFTWAHDPCTRDRTMFHHLTHTKQRQLFGGYNRTTVFTPYDGRVYISGAFNNEGMIPRHCSAYIGRSVFGRSCLSSRLCPDVAFTIQSYARSQKNHYQCYLPLSVARATL